MCRDPELVAMDKVREALEDLDMDAQQRIITWAAARVQKSYQERLFELRHEVGKRAGEIADGQRLIGAQCSPGIREI